MMHTGYGGLAKAGMWGSCYAYLLLSLSSNICAEEPTWSINENEPNPKLIIGSALNPNLDDETMIPSISMVPVHYGGDLRVTLKINEWLGVKPGLKCKGTKVGKSIDKGFLLHKFNDTWIKMTQVCVAYERSDMLGTIDFYMVLLPQTYGDSIKLIGVFKTSNDVIYDNTTKFTAKGFNKTLDVYSKRLEL